MKNPFGYFQIRHKLFAIFILSNILLIVSMWQVFQWSFDRGFVSYATERDKDFLEQMSNRSANLFIYYNDWYFLIIESRQDRNWQQAKLENLRDLVRKAIETKKIVTVEIENLKQLNQVIGLKFKRILCNCFAKT